MLARLLASIVLASAAGAAFADQGSFLGFQAVGPRHWGTLPAEQRERLLRDAYACNRPPGQSLDQRERCQDRQRAARQAVLDQAVANHRLAGSQRQEMRRLYEEQSVPLR